jgi:photosystem II stability/assembly factor-like uncharacterized protein
MRIKLAILLCGAALAASGCKKKGTSGGGGGGWFVGTEGLMVNLQPGDEATTEYDLGATERLNTIACRYTAEAWVGGARGTLLYTSDAGDEWVSHTLPTLADIHAIATQDTGPVFLAGDGVFLTATPAFVTGDAAWTDVGDGVTRFRSVAAARHGETVLAVSDDGGVWSYEAGRLVRRTTIAGADAIAVSADGKTVLLAGAGLARSTDAGLTWSQLAVDPSVRFADVRIDDRGDGFAVGTSGAIARVDLEGRVLLQRAGTADLQTLFVPYSSAWDGVGYAAGDGGQIWLTHDAGWTWELGPNVGRTVLGVDEIGDAHR